MKLQTNFLAIAAHDALLQSLPSLLEKSSVIPCASSFLSESSLLGGNQFILTFQVLVKSQHLLLWVRKQEAKQIIQ